MAVIDRDANAFRRLPPTFEGHRVVGIGFDRETLEEAGITDAFAFAAVSSGDNSNILAARVARETYGVTHVVARIYDPARAEIFERLGIPTVATVGWTTSRIMRRLVPTASLTVHQDPTGVIELTEIAVHPGWIGHSYAELEHAAGGRVAYVCQANSAVIPHPDQLHARGELVRFILASSAVPAAESLLANPPGTPRTKEG